MTIKTKILISLVTLLGVAAAAVQTEQPMAKLTVHVVDERSQPVSEATVRIAFCEKFSRDQVMVSGTTNAQGEFIQEGHSDAISGADARKEGYYISGSERIIFKDAIAGHWQPWNPIAEVILRPVEKPLPLYAKHVQTQVPVLDQACGYDLEKGDWVSPNGKGQNSDLTFTVKRDYKNWFNFAVEAEVKFAQPDDGLMRMKSPTYARNSEFRWERSAPETGYKAPRKIRFVNHDPKSGQAPELTFDTTKDREQGYFFRVRTIEQNGRIVAANYGKITGDIAIDPRDTKTCKILFTYYLNPTSLDRNLEWDTKHNLLQGLSYDQAPREP